MESALLLRMLGEHYRLV